MGHVLSFTHCKDAPSTASSTPDSCPPDGDLDDLAVPSSDDLWPILSTKELTFSYITIGSSASMPRPSPRGGIRRGRGQGRRHALQRDGPGEELREAAYILLEEVGHVMQDSSPEETEPEEKPRLRGEESKAFTDLLYWRDTTLSAGGLTSLTLSLLCLSQFSVISVVSYGCLILLSATVILQVYSQLLCALHRGDGINPFQMYLDADLTLSAQQVEDCSACVLSFCCSTLCTLRRLFLVEDLRESLKFLLLLYLLTYVGATFNGLTLLLLGVIGAFTVPVLYKQHEGQVDHYVSFVTNQLREIRKKILARSAVKED
ncbi:hypothetical protein FKM82_030166 [Ascaphus truei]